MSLFEWPVVWPLAFGGRAGVADFKQHPEDFQVVEKLPFAPAGHGEHLYLKIEKTGQNTVWLARQLAKMADVASMDVSYAGLKDRHGVTVQWFCLRIPGLAPEGEHQQWQSKLAEIEGVRLLESSRHDRKLRIGALEGNHFVIRLRNFEGDRAGIDALLERIKGDGVPNYFGEQRFGNLGHNLTIARKLFTGEVKLAREKRSFALSAARSFLFNQVLAERIRSNSWCQLTEGDVLTFSASASLIFPDRRDESVAGRFQARELLNTGPLWGKGALSSEGQVAELEQSVATQLSTFAQGLEDKGLKQERRALVSCVKDLVWDWQESDLELRFFLFKGSYATSVLHELVEYRTAGGDN